MVPYDHALLSVRDFGGHVDVYIEIHQFIDMTKTHFANYLHRAILHNSFGLYVCEKAFGLTLKNSDNKRVPVREIARRHILQDCSIVLTVEQTLTAVANGTYGKYNNPKKTDLEWLKNN